MVARLSKVAREFNVGISTIVEYLHKHGVDVPEDPNGKLTEEQYELVAKEYRKDGEAKIEATKVNLKDTRKKRETITIDHPDGQQNEIFTPENEEDMKPKLKTVGHIDIDNLSGRQTQKVEVKKAVNSEPKTEKKEVTTTTTEEKRKPIVNKDEQNVVHHEHKTPEVNDTVTVETTPVAEDVKVNDDNKSNDSTEPEIFRPHRKEKPNDVRVIGTIDLSSINQRTRPPKKTRQEREKEREASRKNRQQGGNNTNTDNRPNVQFVDSSTPVVNKYKPSNNQNNDDHKKKRIIRADEKIVATSNPSPADKNARFDDSKRKLKKLKKKKNEKVEIKDEDVDKQIKDTYARLGKFKSTTSKHRRDKRDANQMKEMEEKEMEEKDSKVLKLTEFVTVAELATMMKIGVTDVISACMSLGLFVSINQRLDAETINVVADEFGYSVEFVSVGIQEAIEDEEEADSPENMLPRPPIVTVMGHVDHGKTSLLDYIRKANVIAGEAGGITQHIGAYSVKLQDGRMVTFLDTPGHEAFTAMRARGAQVTDIAIIIIAADDSVMPQTIEAINHATAAGVPIVFAINKIDKPGANPDKIREELANMNFLVEEWGGKYQCQEIAAKKGLNIDKLLEKVLLEAEMLNLKANPHKHATGSIIESSLDKGRGYVATVLVQAGTLHIGDVVLSGSHYGHVKAIFNERGEKLEEAGPSVPALILGLNGAPQAGEKFNVIPDEREARLFANKREQLQREQGLRTQTHITLDEIGRRIAIGNFHEINVIVKGDVDGSIEALSDSLIKLSNDEIQINVIHKAVGQISEGDVMLAAASNAIIVGFQVRPSGGARAMAEKEKIDIRLYSVIYKAIEEMKSAMEGMLSPEIKEEVTGTVEILETFNISKVGTIAGCIVRDGKIERGCNVRLIRDGIVIYTGQLASLKRLKDDVKEVNKGFECGLSITNYNDLHIGDMVEAFKEVEVKKTL